MGATIQDAFYAPHELAAEVQGFIADHDHLYTKKSWHEVAVVFSVASTRELIGRADASDNLANARDESVRVPYRVVTETLSRAGLPFDVVIFPDGETAPDRGSVESLVGYRTIVLPDCFDLTDRQTDALRDCLDRGTMLVVTDRFGESLSAEVRAALLAHPGVRRAEADDVGALTPQGPQVTLSVPLGVNAQRLPDGVAVHLVNYDIDGDHHTVRRTGEVTVSVRFDGVATDRLCEAVLHTPEAPEQALDVRVDDGVRTVTLPDVGVYAVIELKGAGS
jgi:hypothetical protein